MLYQFLKINIQNINQSAISKKYNDKIDWYYISRNSNIIKLIGLNYIVIKIQYIY